MLSSSSFVQVFGMIKPLHIVVLSTFLWFNTAFANTQALPDFTTLVDSHGAAVVNISTTIKKKSHKDLFKREFGSSAEEEAFEELFKRFFDFQGQGKAPRNHGRSAHPLGSGFIISADGYVVTNHHVIDDADAITVKLTDRREFKAKLIGSDQRSDIALLKIEATDLPFLTLGNSTNLKVGEWVLAIGAPFGFDNSVTAGIVSAKGRSLPSDNYVPFIQTDVAINPGNSGGPLFNLAGEVIGINSQIYSRSGGFMGVSFAIPSHVAANVIQQLKSSGQVNRAWLGVFIQEVDRELAKTFKMDRPQGALVAKIIEDSPAIGKLLLGDIILAFNGQAVSTVSVLPTLVAQAEIGKAFAVKILRNGVEKIVNITLAKLPKTKDFTKKSPEKSAKPVKKSIMGMTFSDLDAEMQKASTLKSGVLISSITEGVAKEAGFRKGDIITLWNGEKIKTVAQLTQSIKTQKGKSVAVLVNRNGSARFLALNVSP
jgi:serine protease Do